jgi:hypothetical protein
MGPYITASGLSGKQGEEPDPEQVEICKRWLQEFARPGSRWHIHSSYGLKHIVERWAGEYVSNGAFILAALELGYSSRPYSRKSPNVAFKMVIKGRPARG